jgi:hypothetical protein
MAVLILETALGLTSEVCLQLKGSSLHSYYLLSMWPIQNQANLELNRTKGTKREEQSKETNVTPGNEHWQVSEI